MILFILIVWPPDLKFVHPVQGSASRVVQDWRVEGLPTKSGSKKGIGLEAVTTNLSRKRLVMFPDWCTDVRGASGLENLSKRKSLKWILDVAGQIMCRIWDMHCTFLGKSNEMKNRPHHMIHFRVQNKTWRSFQWIHTVNQMMSAGGNLDSQASLG